MSGYETSFAGGEDEVRKSPEFQHDAGDEAEAADGPDTEEPDTEEETPASADVLDAEQAGMTG